MVTFDAKIGKDMSFKSLLCKTLLGLLILMGATPAAAQQWLGTAISKYGGTNAMYTNTASLGGNK